MARPRCDSGFKRYQQAPSQRSRPSPRSARFVFSRPKELSLSKQLGLRRIQIFCVSAHRSYTPLTQSPLLRLYHRKHTRPRIDRILRSVHLHPGAGHTARISPRVAVFLRQLSTAHSPAQSQSANSTMCDRSRFSSDTHARAPPLALHISREPSAALRQAASSRVLLPVIA